MKFYFLVYIVIISLLAIIVTVSDKYKATKSKRYRRTPESSLLSIAFLGGSVAMFLTMLFIRHKTRKPKFMVGLPIIIAVQIGLLFLSIKTGGAL